MIWFYVSQFTLHLDTDWPHKFVCTFAHTIFILRNDEKTDEALKINLVKKGSVTKLMLPSSSIITECAVKNKDEWDMGSVPWDQISRLRFSTWDQFERLFHSMFQKLSNSTLSTVSVRDDKRKRSERNILQVSYLYLHLMIIQLPGYTANLPNSMYGFANCCKLPLQFLLIKSQLRKPK